MRLSIHAIGKMRAGPEASLTQDYLKRARDMGRQLGFTGPDFFEFEPPRGLAGRARTNKEADWLLNTAGDGPLIALDERGKNVSSEDFAATLAKLRDDGAKQTSLVIGGADGHAGAVRDKALHILSFGKATWPHMLVRAMLAEQLYRTMTILSGHPYHRS